MNDILKLFSTSLIGIVIAVFLPKQIFICIREIVLFGLKSILKYWKLNALLNLILLALSVKLNIIDKYGFTRFILGLFLLILAISITISLFSIYIQLSTRNTLIVYGCYSSKEKEYLFLDLDAALVNDRIQKDCNQLSRQLFILSSKNINLIFVELPKFMPILLGYRGTKRIFDKFIFNRRHISSIYFVRDIADQKMLTNLNYDPDNFINGDLMSSLISLQNKISNEKIDIKEIASINLKLYALVFGQSLLDYFVVEKAYSDASRIIDDTGKMLLEIKQQIRNSTISEIIEFNDFYFFWSSYIDRYKAILLLEQDEIRGSIVYTISAIRLNPYYPYSNYSTFKSNFSKRYGLELSYTIEAITREQFEPENVMNYEDFRAQLSNSIVAKDADFNSKILLKILAKDIERKSCKYLEDELKTLDNSNPAILLLKSDVIKYLPDGTEKVNEIYYGRIDETISILNEVLKLDGNFPIVKAKIGSLMLCKAIYDGVEEDIKRSVDILAEGMYFMTELGFNTNET